MREEAELQIQFGSPKVYDHGMFDPNRETFCKIRDGSANSRYVILMEHAGEELERGKAWPMHNVLDFAIQIVHEIQRIHKLNYLHHDIKRDNCLIKNGNVKLIDFGLSLPYVDKSGQTDDEKVSEGDTTQVLPHKRQDFWGLGRIRGTSKYMGIDALSGWSQSRRDELEACLYLFIYFAKGSLPWQDIYGECCFCHCRLSSLKMQCVRFNQDPEVGDVRRVLYWEEGCSRDRCSGGERHERCGKYYPARIEAIPEKVTEITDFMQVEVTNTTSASTLRIGTAVEVLTRDQNWLSCEVVDVRDEGNEVKVHYAGFAEKYDEWIHINSERLKMSGNRKQGVTIKSVSNGKAWIVRLKNGEEKNFRSENLKVPKFYDIVFYDGAKRKIKYEDFEPDEKATDLFKDLPECFSEFLEECRKLGHEEKPNYDGLCGILEKQFELEAEKIAEQNSPKLKSVEEAINACVADITNIINAVDKGNLNKKKNAL